ncbi:MAG: VWA domain-containing protein [Gemmatimonadetes bacterium]|nr:VWA domain-containing protein [Gemmatimonadota bacterium]
MRPARHMGRDEILWLEVKVRALTDIRRWCVVLAMLFAYVTPGQAQGWIEPGVNRGGFAVDKVRSEVSVRIQGRVALIEVSEWFVNEGDRLAEGEYLYPLPGEAVFQGFSLFQGDTELRGEIMDAERAREIYEAIVRRRADPALIELAGQGLLRARIFPIEPGETRKVSLRYTQVLERAGNALQFVYAGSVRGGAQVGAGEVLRMTPEGVETRFEIVVDDCDEFLDPFSPTHTLDVDRDDARMTISIEDEIVGRLSVFLPMAGEAVGISIAMHRPIGEDGYFMLTLSPGRNVEAVEPRDLTVVMDVSGSMSGEKIEQARQALHQLLRSLSPEDRFRLVAFSSAVRVYSREWVPARGRALEQAHAWIDGLVADGGTNIEAALEEAFRLESPRNRLPVVLFLTDGLPSVGEESPNRLASIAESKAGRARVFAFGIGNDVNTQLLDRLSEAGRGDTDYVLPGENVERALSLLAAKIQHPVLTDLELWGGPIDISEVYPVHVPDVFAGEELVLFGRFTGEGQSQLTVRGQRLGRPLEFTTELMIPDASDRNDFIPRLWASRKLGHLERQVWTEGMTESLAGEIRTLALRYGLPSRFTSYLVQEPDVVVATPMNAQVQALPSLPRLVHRVANEPAPTTGATAVQAAQGARRMREMTSAEDLERAEDEMWADVVANGRGDAVRKAAAGRLFEMRDGVWTDVAFVEGQPVTEVRAFSRAWFDLIEAMPELEVVLRENKSVVIAGQDLSLKVGDKGAEELTATELQEVVDGFRGVTGA